MTLRKVKVKPVIPIKSKEKFKHDNLSMIKSIRSKKQLMASQGAVGLMKKMRHTLPRFLPRHGKMHVR